MPLPDPAPIPANRSMPPAVVIPELAYPDVPVAAAWLCGAFGFTERLRIGRHRAQLAFGPGSLVVTQLSPDVPAASAAAGHSVMVRVDDVDAHHAHARDAGVAILNPPTDYPFGERQYTAADFFGRRWTFSQTIADVDPATWGGVVPSA
ncbi:MAG: VOC family protein [Anaerolineales bacterium]|nr:VOC family protein [Anaerolineales bacterium]